DLPSPTTLSLVRRTHAGIRRAIGTAQAAKAPAVVTDLKRMLLKVPDTRVGLRDRALMLLGFAGAFRRSELVSLNVEGLEFARGGHGGFRARRWRASSNVGPPPSAWIPNATPATRSALAWPPAPQLVAPPSAPSWPRPATARPTWCGATSARRTCLPPITRPVW